MNRFPEIMLVVIAIAALFWLGYDIYDTVKHPCIRYEDVETTCGGEMVCTYYDPNDMTCVVWGNNPTYPCTVQQCVERKP